MGATAALAGAVSVAAAVAARPGAAPGSPRLAWFDTPNAAVAAALSGFAGGVVAFGELHQTSATVGIPSALRRFTDGIFPPLAGRFSHLVIETWRTTGRCGADERAVTADVERTTERPAQTESEIEALIRVAYERGVVPRILSISCADYQSMRGDHGGAVDYDRTLRITARALETAIVRGLGPARSMGEAGGRPDVAAPAPGPRFVGVYGGALHNDLHPEPELAAYSFAPRVLAATLGKLVEIDLVVPEYASSSVPVRAQPWWRLYARGPRPGATALITRDPRSFVVIFPRQPRARDRRDGHDAHRVSPTHR